MISIAAPDIGEDEKQAVQEVMDSGMIAEGPRVKEFEERFAEYCGTKYAVAVSSGTAALHLALMAHDVGPGDEVITSPFTFIASANSIILAGAKPVFADISEDTFNLDPESVKEKITEKTKAVMPVHLFGHPADMREFLELGLDHDFTLIEDACQAHGAEYDSMKAGSFGTGCFSFYPTKNMTSGEGGMITTDNEEVQDKARSLRQHGMSRRYYHDGIGYNYRMTDIAAAIGLAQLGKLDTYNEKRRQNAAYLTENIKNESVALPTVREKCVHVFHQYTVRLTQREIMVKELAEKGVGCGIYYPLPIHKQPYYLELGYDESLPNAEKAAEEVLSLPVHPKLTSEELEHICGVVNML